jgi:putative ubiquitin-RnfH superfamily antitoxin RatB of RatAB toxin-antitoxin module
MTLEIEVVYALAGEQSIVRLHLPDGSTVADALASSGLLESRPELGAACKVGVWGRVAPRTQMLKDGDRVEVYRPLTADPKLARRRKAEGERKRR